MAGAFLLLDDHRHGHRARVPATGGQTPEMGLGGFLVRKVEGLRVVGAGKGDDFVATDKAAAEPAHRAHFEVFVKAHGGKGVPCPVIRQLRMLRIQIFTR